MLGSFLISSFFFIYDKRLFTYEEWDEDYQGCVDYINPVADDFVMDFLKDKQWLNDLEVPLVIHTSALKNVNEKTGRILENTYAAHDLLSFVRGFLEQGISVYPKYGILEKRKFLKYVRNKEWRYEDYLQRSAKFNFLCSVFGVSKDISSGLAEYLVEHNNNKYRIRILCPEYVALQDVSSGLFFLWDLCNVEEANISWRGKIKIPNLSVEFTTHSKSLNYPDAEGKLAVISF